MGVIITLRIQKKTLEYKDYSDENYQIAKVYDMQFHFPIGYREMALLEYSTEDYDDFYMYSYSNEDRSISYFVTVLVGDGHEYDHIDYTNESWQKESLQSLDEAYDASELLETKAMNVAGIEGWFIRYAYRNSDEETRYVEEVRFKREDVLYNISLSDKSGGSSSLYSDDFSGILNSIVLK